MQLPRNKTTIISLPAGLLLLLVLLLGGCSSLRLAYSSAPQLTWWWLDAYADFSREHSPVARQAVDSFFEWHRRTQLPIHARWLAGVRQQVPEPITTAQACTLQTQLREQLEPSLQQALALGAELVPLLGEPQLQAIEKRYAKNNEKMRDELLQPDLATRQAESFKRTLERAERLYGRLDEAQQRVLRDGLATSPFQPERLLAERQRAQRDALATLRTLQAERADNPARLAALKALAQRTEVAGDAEQRAYQQRLQEHNCALIARLHNATTPAQREHARRKLGGWENDLRSLLGD